jgi:hypothetical protein
MGGITDVLGQENARLYIPFHFLVIALLPELSAANTFFSPGEGSCQIIGDGDVYGIGIRFSYYLQWASGIISVLIDAPEDINRGRTAANIITLAVFINCIRDIAEGGLMSIEWIIVSYLVLVSNLALPPWRWDMLYDGRSSLGWSLMLLCVQWLIEPWLYFSGVDQGIKEGCSLTVQNPVPYEVHDQRYSVAQQVWSVFLVVISAATLLPAVTLLSWDIMDEIDPKALTDEQLPWLARKLKRVVNRYAVGRFKLSPIRLRYLWVIGQIILGPISIVSIEGTIALNDIDLSAAPLDSAGQLIPFLAGAFSLCIALVSVLRRIIRAMGWWASHSRQQVQPQVSVQDSENKNDGEATNAANDSTPQRQDPQGDAVPNEDPERGDSLSQQIGSPMPRVLRYSHTC